MKRVSDAPESGGSGKRARENGVVLSPLNAELFSEASRERQSQAFSSAKPYTHGTLSPLCADGFLREVRDELVTHLTATFKETDLFKVLQTGDLAGIDEGSELGKKMPSLMALRAALYSREFRSFVSEVTGCGDLTDTVDCSSNIYSAGGHLLCHDDVIGTRCVSYIVYLTDPDEAWEATDGGGLELYPLGGNNTGGGGDPEAAPSCTLLPHWNTMAFFTVQPGRSFHSVQEVFADDKPRLSISGWYHKEHPPEGADTLASLSQLQSGHASSLHYAPCEIVADDALSGEDHKVLSEWVSAEYLKNDAIADINARFCEDSSVQLRNFLRPEIAGPILDAAREADAADALGASGSRPPSYAAGLASGSWKAVGPPHKQRYLRAETDAAASTSAAEGPRPVGSLLTTVRNNLFRSAAFAKYVSLLAGGHLPKACRAEVRRFRPGLDYTVAHLGVVTRDPCLDATLCFVDDADPEREAAWSMGECGGFECYIEADEESDQPAEIYREEAAKDNQLELLSVSALSNTLSLVHRNEGIMRFVKYVSAAAPSSRFDIAGEFLLEEEEDAEEEAE
mmetsp:Transcript_14009/g.46001  ORF Transcript_14009/g.46001 Transcript_14009/m.46001 type:complete len:567 (+) Transcript_14009:37-1737(+)